MSSATPTSGPRGQYNQTTTATYSQESGHTESNSNTTTTTTKSSTLSFIPKQPQPKLASLAGQNNATLDPRITARQRERSATLSKLDKSTRTVPIKDTSRPATANARSNRDRDEARSSYIDINMSSSQLGNNHTAQDSNNPGYQSSTIGTNSLPAMTIGVKRGADLLASRRGPQITGNPDFYNSPTHAQQRGASAPSPHRVTQQQQHPAKPANNANTSITNFFDPLPNHISTGGEAQYPLRGSSASPHNPRTVAQARRYTEDEQAAFIQDQEDEDENEELESDDGIEQARAYPHADLNRDRDHERDGTTTVPDDDSSQLDGVHGELPLAADPARHRGDLSMDRTPRDQQPAFYKLQANGQEGSSNAARSKTHGQILSSEALAGERNFSSNTPISTFLSLQPPRLQTSSILACPIIS